MIETFPQIKAIAFKEIHDAIRTYIIVAVAGFLLLAAMVALAVSGIAMHVEVAAYNEGRDQLIALGQSAADLPPPAFFPLKLLRGFIEQIEIIGAVLGIVLGYRAAAIERGRNTLALVMTRPIGQTTFLAGKIGGNLVLIAVSLAVAFLAGTIGIVLVAGVSLSVDECLRVFLPFLAATAYAGSFFLLGLYLALHLTRLPHALLYAFAIWLILVLVLPQIGDTMDPDNQIAGGVFHKLGLAKPQEREILATFATYETLRNAIEEASPAKHFERLTFALTGIKDTYSGMAIGPVLYEKLRDVLILIGIFAGLCLLVFWQRIDFTRITKET